MTTDKTGRLMCTKPDRDVPELICGYQLPCPHHTVMIHIHKTPPTVEIPATAEKLIDIGKLELLKEVARTLQETDDE